METALGNIETIVKQDVLTYYKLHPQALSEKPEDAEFKGRVITMVNLPNEEKYHRILWMRKGYKADPQELMPKAELTNEDGEFRFNLDSPTRTEEVSEFKCETCGKICASEFGLKSHQRSHK